MIRRKTNRPRGGLRAPGKRFGICVAAILLCLGPTVQAQTQPPDSSYVLFLPSGYAPGRPWPVLFCFDPGRQGSRPVALFREAAGRDGVILVSSNGFSAGDSTRKVLRMLDSLWQEASRRCEIDPRRVYATGFSGGARICWLFARALQGVDVAGVIGVGAGLPARGFLDDWQPRDFDFYGLTGETDFNYPEMRALDRVLEDKGIRRRIVPFAGGHDWPDSTECGAALDWMMIAAMRKGTAAPDSSLIARVYRYESARAAAERRAGLVCDAYDRYRSVADGLGGLCDISAAADAARRLEPERTRALALRSGIEARADERLDAAVAELELFASARNAASRLESKDLAARLGITELQKESRGADRDRRLAARRVLEGIYVRVFRTIPSALQRRGDWAGMAGCFRVAAEVKPAEPRVYYNLACALSRSGDAPGAIAALGRAVDLGFADRHSVESDPDLDAIRQNPAFGEILARIR